MSLPITPAANQAYGTTAPNYAGIFIPEVWSGMLVKNLYDATVLGAISNTDYEGEIKKEGDVVNIRTTPTTVIHKYEKGLKLTIDKPEAPKIQLLINNGAYFSFNIDDVDKYQSDINLMNIWSMDASKQMAIYIDKLVLTSILPDISAKNRGATAGARSASIDLGITGTPITLTKSNILEFIVDMGVVLDESNTNSDGRYLIVTPQIAGLIKKSDLKDASLAGDTTSILRNGRLGMIDRFTIYISQNLKVSTAKETNIIAGDKMGLTFATQMERMETLRAETSFGDLIRSLTVFGYKVIKSDVLCTAIVKV